VAVINNRDAGSREQVAALLATADALVEANQGAVLPLPRQLASPHAAPLSRRERAVAAANCSHPNTWTTCRLCMASFDAVATDYY